MYIDKKKNIFQKIYYYFYSKIFWRKGWNCYEKQGVFVFNSTSVQKENK